MVVKIRLGRKMVKRINLKEKRAKKLKSCMKWMMMNLKEFKKK